MCPGVEYSTRTYVRTYFDASHHRWNSHLINVSARLRDARSLARGEITSVHTFISCPPALTPHQSPDSPLTQIHPHPSPLVICTLQHHHLHTGTNIATGSRTRPRLLPPSTQSPPMAHLPPRTLAPFLQISADPSGCRDRTLLGKALAGDWLGVLGVADTPQARCSGAYVRMCER